MNNQWMEMFESEKAKKKRFFSQNFLTKLISVESFNTAKYGIWEGTASGGGVDDEDEDEDEDEDKDEDEEEEAVENEEPLLRTGGPIQDIRCVRVSKVGGCTVRTYGVCHNDDDDDDDDDDNNNDFEETSSILYAKDSGY
jgi:hypothetical protein